jgi:HPt (histidine-containing phosphotransfer) domain-containing protein
MDIIQQIQQFFIAFIRDRLEELNQQLANEYWELAIGQHN